MKVGYILTPSSGVLVLVAYLGVDDRVRRDRACAVEEEEQEDQRVEGRLLEVVRVVLDVAEGEALPAGGGQVEVHGRAHRDEKGEGRRAGEEADDQQRAAPELGVVVHRGPQLRRPRQEAEVGLDDIVNKPVEARGAEVRRPEPALGPVVDHQHPEATRRGSSGTAWMPSTFFTDLKSLGPVSRSSVVSPP
eukprot:CAMPEP_0168400810 /NCGR_PEP_ID=MMETSP0228-20121227/22789_1 /TAXON_ID=133427 /ORGANISM="Protoceratium reticulatum, Strain CCCM 535 (=CCMP 1889)" /LENGTH=190 /DNA_ID=CAMNT_0008414361 /DNA_START=99 /DNA_END=668 /DNA_ORIENTATION=+